MDHVNVRGVNFPRMTRTQAVTWLSARIAARRTTAVCFPDMSTMNQIAADPSLLSLLQERFVTLNDGVGVAWAARRRGRPLPDNLNGTDLCPALLSRLPEGTRVYLLGAAPQVVVAAGAYVKRAFPHLDLVGTQDGYFPGSREPQVIEGLAQAAPQLVLVAMGNPLQVRLIGRHLDDPRLQGVTWLAVGGLLDYWGGHNRRAPRWLRSLRLEWAWIVARQPYKVKRYFLGIPRFLWTYLQQEQPFGGTQPYSAGQ